MKIRELLLCALEPEPMQQDMENPMLGGDVAPMGGVQPMQNPMDPMQQGQMQMAQGPVPMMPDSGMNSMQGQLKKADSIMNGPLGRLDPSTGSSTGNSYSSMIGNKPLPLK